MDKAKLYTSVACITFLIVSGIIGSCIIFGSKIVAKAIKEAKINVAGESRPMPDLANLPPWALPQGEANKGRLAKVEGVTAGQNAIKGNTAAKILMVEFSDFQCPFSKKFYQDVFPQIEKEYIATGKVKFSYRNFPLGFHPQAMPAAIACECAGRQGKYWQMFDKISNSNSLDLVTLKGFAKEAGLNTKSFDDCLDTQRTKDIVEADKKEAMRLGVEGTPTFFVNGRLLVGAMPFDEFKKIIDEELIKK